LPAGCANCFCELAPKLTWLWGKPVLEALSAKRKHSAFAVSDLAVAEKRNFAKEGMM